MTKKFLLPLMAAFCVIITILCGIFYVASQATVRLTPKREISADSPGRRWVHAGENFLWTIEE